MRIPAAVVALSTLTIWIGAAAQARPMATLATRHCHQTAAGGFFVHLRVRGASCATGSHVMHRWIQKSGFAANKSPLRRRVRVHAWRCRLVLVQTSENPYGRVTCKASHRRWLRFYGYS